MIFIHDFSLLKPLQHMIDKKHKKSDGDILKTDEPNNTSDSTQHQTSRKTRIGNRVSVFRNGQFLVFSFQPTFETI